MGSNATRKLIFIFLSLMAVNNLSFGQEAEVNVSLDSNNYMIGDYIRADFRAVYPEGWDLIWPDYINTGADIEFINALPIDTSLSDREVTLFSRVNYIVFDSGEYVFPRMAFSLFNRKNNDTLSLFSDSILFIVSSPEVDTSLAIKPIKAPLEVSRPFPWLIVLIILAVIALSVFLYFFFKKRKNRVPAQHILKEEPRDPWLHAMSSLKLLEEEKLWQKGEIKEYYSKLTDVIREYIEFRYQKPALESTSDEILEDLLAVGVNREQREHLGFLFQTSDLVKFAKGFPIADDHTRCLEYGYDFVQKTKPEILKEDNGKLTHNGLNHV